MDSQPSTNSFLPQTRSSEWYVSPLLFENPSTNNNQSLDLGLFLSVYGTVMDGNPLFISPGWSIGGPPKNANEQNLLGNLLGLLGTPDGISGSHNKYETDTSPTRGDLYQYGNGYALQLSQFQTLFDLQPDPATANYNMEVLAKERKITFERSIAENPHF
ncbi:hypothetical protein BDZ45DRAFT_680345 [Acephala macrosclerotiorum]|nr:hypothetical protein BDZ45DRAFT_680345 [Acephala macrosclerotiorum]